MFICAGESTAVYETGSGDKSQTHRNNEIYFYESKVVLGPQPPAKDIFINPDEIPTNSNFNCQIIYHTLHFL